MFNKQKILVIIKHVGRSADRISFIADGILFFGSDNHILGVEADTGKTVYDLVFDRGIIGKRSGAFVPKDDILYFAAERWKKVFIGSPQLTGMYLYALNIKTGKYRWHIYMKNVLFLNLSLDNNTLLTTTQNKVLSLDTKSGSVIWEVYHVNDQIPITPISNGYFDTSDGYNFSAYSVESGKEIWKTKGIIPEGSRIEISNPCVRNGDVYFIAGVLHGPHFFYALDAKTGKLMWKKELGKYL